MMQLQIVELRNVEASLQELRTKIGAMTVEEVQRVRSQFKLAQEIAAAQGLLESVRSEFIKLEFQCVGRLMELGARDAVSVNLRQAAGMSIEDIELLIIAHPSATSLGSLFALQRNGTRECREKQAAVRWKNELDRVVPHVGQLAEMCCFKDEKFTVVEVVSEAIQGKELPEEVVGLLRSGLAKAMTNQPDVIVYGLPVPQFVGFVDVETAQWVHVSIEYATPDQLRLVAQLRRRDAESQVLRAKALDALASKIEVDPIDHATFAREVAQFGEYTGTRRP